MNDILLKAVQQSEAGNMSGFRESVHTLLKQKALDAITKMNAQVGAKMLGESKDDDDEDEDFDEEDLDFLDDEDFDDDEEASDYKPRSKKEQEFKDKHVIKKTNSPSATEAQFKGK